MLSERAGHVLAAIEDFEICLSDATAEMLKRDESRRLAVERSFEIICAAVRLLPDSAKVQQPQIDWQAMADLDSRLHDLYYCNNTDDLLGTATRNLPALKAFAERVVRECHQ